MPAPASQLSVADAFRFYGSAAAPESAPSPGGERVGVELEWLVLDRRDPRARVAHGLVDDELVTRSLPAQSRVTFEPGGQLEVSTRPERGIGPACAAATADVAALARRLGRRGIALVGLGTDPLRPPQRCVRTPRYDAMEAYFDAFGPDGRRMMCATAAVQVNVGLGDAGRWHRAHLLGPVLAATFANSPISGGEPSGWRSARLATWAAMDRSRTAPVGGDDPGSAWARYALDAPVMLIRQSEDRYVPLRNAKARPMAMRQWLEHGSPWGWPTSDDLAYHATTLFPPVRPRGWLELRMIDALPDPWWQVAVAVTAGALDSRVARPITAACAPVAGRWQDAARHGLSHRDLGAAARRVFDAVTELLPDLGGSSDTAGLVDEFRAQYVDARRCPADDRLDEWSGTGSCIPPDRPPRERTWT